MPATRTPARQTMLSFHNAGELSLQSYEAHPYKGTPSKAPTRDALVPATKPPTTKRRRSPNAFILFRSFIIANKLFPPELTHQNDVSRYIAGLWRSGSPTLRSLFFEKADAEKLRVETEGHPEPYRTRRVRTRKPRPSKATNSGTLFYLPESPTTAASEGSLPPSLPFSFSPDVGSPSASQFMFAPTVSVPFGLPSTSVPESPQVIAAIPTSLSSWDYPTEMQITEEQLYPYHGFSFSSEASPFLPLPYDNVVGFDATFQNQFDSTLWEDANNSSQMYSGADSPFPSLYAPSCGPPFPSLDV